jgi:hypothetical protein
MVGEHEGCHPEVPRVFSGVFASRAIGQPVASLDRLEPVKFEEEAESGQDIVRSLHFADVTHR